MSLIALAATALLSVQTTIPAPRYSESDVVRLERCVLGGDDMATCGDFSVEVEALTTCASQADLSGGPEAFVEAWNRCDDHALPCWWEKPEPGQSALVVRNCSARGVATRKIIAARWLDQLDRQLTPADRALLLQVEKRMLEGLEMPADSDDPLRASGRWSGTWASYLQFLRIAQLSGKVTP
ncbi:hypothetical protein [Brevundimonas sp.]|uniref:hypothetical protein n=1 Tax=Brevundimonas sp. TaxID=1871086 RepID=UPI00272FF4BC|nr:hypothetical protein [Brevundimonas sp.]MDP1913023.1 hypothetical protein [Brevundimonas sp.]